ncbi:YrhB domain-containing protein [Streptomyces canus]|uniref:YrhB domain-containing protein n=1 Tax=Streptomyces canus TaxID=58343 RepID=UPI00386F1FA8
MSVDAMRMAVVRVGEHELVWIVSWQSEEFVRTRNRGHMLVGNGPNGRPTTGPGYVGCRCAPR